MESRRAESFSDGVFAVAITVLVFNLLSIGHGVLTYRVLLHSWPQYAAYVVSFLTIGIMWLNHHTMLSLVSKVDRTTLALNTFLLMGVVAVPFPTALVADHLGANAPAGARVAAVIYGLVLILISVGFAAMWLYLSAHQVKLAGIAISTPRRASLRFTAGLGGYVAGTVVAAFGAATVALGIYGVIAVYYLFEHLPEPGASDEPGDSTGQPGASSGETG
jgi:uncharacterized membrane protein